MSQNLRCFSRSFIIFLALISFASFDGLSQLTISIGSPVDATEGSGLPASVLISLDNGAINTTGADITGTISVVGGTATLGFDYMAPVSFAIANGSNSVGVLIPIIDDPVCEGVETIILVISNVNAGTINPSNNVATVQIFDDDFCSLISIGSPVDAIEGTSDITFDVFIEGGLLNTSGSPITGSIDYPGGSASVNSDYTTVNSFLIPDGANSTTITLPVIDDGITELTESVIPTLIGAPSLGSYGNTTTTAYIIDDDASNVSISIGSPVDGAEGGSDISYVVSLDFGAVNGTGSPISGSIAYSGTTGAADVVLPGVSFSILDGMSTDTITVVVVDDFLLECDETVIATISNPSVGTISMDTSTAIIIDDECSQTAISIGSPVDGEEGGANASFVVSLDNGITNATGGPITGDIDYTGTATVGVDYTDISGWSIPDGASFVIHELPIIDDIDDECDESVIATISNPSFATINTATDSATIVDNDCTNGVDVLGQNELSIYPNPASSSVNFESEIRMSSYAIIDLNGRILSEGRVNAKAVKLNTDFLANGSYIVNVTFEDGTALNSKILKE